MTNLLGHTNFTEESCTTESVADTIYHGIAYKNSRKRKDVSEKKTTYLTQCRIFISLRERNFEQAPIPAR